jgi:type II secretory pathway pseudopilin PulG
MRIMTIVTAVAVLSGTALAGSPDVSAQLEAMQKQLQQQQQLIEAQQTQIQKLRQNDESNWLSEQQAAQVRALIQDVLSDADTRASLASDGLTSGYDGGFFIRSADGSYSLNVNLQSQIRYTFNTINSRDVIFPVNDSNFGFSLRRTKIGFSGNAIDPSLTYNVVLNAAAGYDIPLSISEDAIGPSVGGTNLTTGGSVFIEDAWVQWDLGKGWALRVGQFKAPLMRDELVDSRHQLAVERGISTNLMTAGRTQGVQISYTSQESDIPFRVMVMFHDGSLQANTDMGQSMFDLGIAARVEVLLSGTWKQFEDYVSSPNDERGILLGAGINYDVGNEDGNLSIANLIGGFIGGGVGDVSPDVFTWTLDASAEFPEWRGLTVMAAFTGRHALNVDDTALGGGFGAPSSVDQYALMLQAGAFLVPEKIDVFFRYEYMYFADRAAFVNLGPLWLVVPTEEKSTNVLTFGGNYYFNGHNSKLSFDLVFVVDSMAFGSQGASLVAGSGNQVAIRAQYQLLF